MPCFTSVFFDRLIFGQADIEKNAKEYMELVTNFICIWQEEIGSECAPRHLASQSTEELS